MIQAPLVDDAATRRRSSAARYESPLPLAGLVALTFFSVTGGPFGQELLVKAGGPLVALGSFALMTLLWSVPEALMTAELSSAFPEAAGFAAWSNAAYGPRVPYGVRPPNSYYVSDAGYVSSALRGTDGLNHEEYRSAARPNARFYQVGE